MMSTLVQRLKTTTYHSERHGYRSGLEQVIAQDLMDRGVHFDYEEMVIRYKKPETSNRYTPDFVLENGIIIEGKGRFMAEDRRKHLLVKAQHPDLDIRFVFQRSKQRISKASKTTYADWCEKNGFQYADGVIPQAWIDEQPK